MLGQLLRGGGPHGGGVDGVAIARHEVGDQALVARAVFAQRDHRAGHPGVGSEHRFDFAELDAEAAQLHLVVGAADEFERLVLPPAHHVAGAVHAAAGRPIGVGHEAVGGEAGAVEVATRQADAGDVELAGHAHRAGAQLGVEHHHHRVRDGAAHRNTSLHAASSGFERGTHRGADGRLGRAVGVDHAAPRSPARHQLGRAGFATHRQHLEQREAVLGFGDGGQRGRRDQRMGDLQVDQHFGQDLAHHHFAQRHHQRGTGAEGHQHLHDRGVEAGRGQLRHARIGRHFQLLDEGLGHVGHALMRDEHALGSTGRARGVDQVGRLGQRAGRRRRVAVRLALEHVLRLVGVEHQQRREGVEVGGQVPRGAAVGEHEGRAGVFDHVADALGRVVRVDGQESSAGLEHGQLIDHHLAAARQRHGHDAARAHATRPQRMRQAVGAGVERGVAPGERAGDQGDGVGRALDLGFEQRGKTGCVHGKGPSGEVGWTAGATGAVVQGGARAQPMPHCETSSSRSSGNRTSICANGKVGASEIVSSSTTRRATRASAVARSNRSVRYSR